MAVDKMLLTRSRHWKGRDLSKSHNSSRVEFDGQCCRNPFIVAQLLSLVADSNQEGRHDVEVNGASEWYGRPFQGALH